MDEPDERKAMKNGWPSQKKKRTMNDPAERKYDRAERKEMNHG